MQWTKAIPRYFKYAAKASTRYGVHSPFVYRLITEVFYSSVPVDVSQTIGKIRGEHLRSDHTLPFVEMGAARRPGEQQTLPVRHIARRATVPPKYGHLLFRLARWRQPKTSLELGTSLGVSGAWLAMGAPRGHLHTIEGNGSVLDLARESFQKAGIGNISTHQGAFREKLPEVLHQMNSLDLLYLDGDHRCDSTLAYFEQCLAKVTNDSLFILDDIHWSRGMEEAWVSIQEHPSVTLTLDLFRFGLVFFRREQRHPLHLTLWY